MTKSSTTTSSKPKATSAASSSSPRAHKASRARGSSNKLTIENPSNNNTISSDQQQQQPYITAVASSSKNNEQKQQRLSTGSSISSNSSTEPTNEFDTVLGEAHDLLGAAAEAQALGRLKMANTYLLLLHVRLIGLGKRFDRAILSNPESFSNLTTASSISNTATTASANATAAQPHTTETNATETATNSASTGDQQEAGPAEQDDAAIKLSQVLPHGIDLDSTMVEHLARAAMELHNKRTGKVSLIRHANEQQSAPPRAVAWSTDEHNRCMEASQQFGTTKVGEIAKAVGTRTETEVKAHLRNVSSKEKVSEQLLDGAGIKKKNGGKAKKPPSKAVYTDAYHHFDAKLHLYGI